MIRAHRAAAFGLLLFLLQARGFERTELLPSGNTAMRITQAEQLWQAFDAAYGNRPRNDEKIQDFAHAFGEKIKMKTADGTVRLESLQLLEMLKLLNGEIVLVYEGGHKAPLAAVRIYLAATASEKEFGNIIERTDWLQSQADEETVRQRDTFQGVEIVHDIMRGGTEQEKHYWMGCTRGTMLLGSDREWIEQGIVRLQAETVDEPEGSKLSFRYPIKAWMQKKLDALDPEARKEKEMLWNALGWFELEQGLLELEMVQGSLVVDSRFTITNPGRGLFALLDTAPESFSDDRIVPQNASSFSYGKIDLPGLWKKLPEILGTLPPRQAAPIARMTALFQQQSGLDIEHDILAHAGNRFTLHTELAGTNQPMLVTLELANDRAFAQSLDTLLASPFAKGWAQQVKTTQYRGRTIHHKKNTSDPSKEPWAVCATDRRLLIGSNADIVRETILRMESSSPPLHPPMRAAARKYAPANAFGYGAMDHRKAEALVYIKVSDNSFSAGIGFQADVDVPKNQGTKDKPGTNEISLNHLTSFLSMTYHYMEAVPEGIHHRLVFENDETQGAL